MLLHAVAYLIAGLAYVAAPHMSLLAVFGFPVSSAASTYVWRTTGCAMATLLPAVTHSLKVRARLTARVRLGDTGHLNHGFLEWSVAF